MFVIKSAQATVRQEMLLKDADVAQTANVLRDSPAKMVCAQELFIVLEVGQTQTHQADLLWEHAQTGGPLWTLPQQHVLTQQTQTRRMQAAMMMLQNESRRFHLLNGQQLPKPAGPPNAEFLGQTPRL
jgi:hypothetical protein